MEPTKSAAASSNPQQPQISALSWEGNREQCPCWVGYPTRESLPATLNWTGPTELPAVGSTVTIYMNSYGPATVEAYFHAAGVLGVICRPYTLPDWFKKQSPGVSTGHFVGRDLVAHQRPATAAETTEAARRFWYTLGPNAKGRGTRSEMLSAKQLLLELTREPLEKCLKRESSHLLMIWEYFEGTDREASCLATFWVGSYAGIKLTNWQQEFLKFAK
jgi:hypothetical protein